MQDGQGGHSFIRPGRKSSLQIARERAAAEGQPGAPGGPGAPRAPGAPATTTTNSPPPSVPSIRVGFNEVPGEPGTNGVEGMPELINKETDGELVSLALD